MYSLKSLSLKYYIRKPLIGSLIFLSLIFFLSSCTSGTKDKSFITDFNPLISAFTSGTISGESNIRIQLSADLENYGAGSNKLEERVFEFSPSIKGSAYIIDKRTIEFRPEKRLTSGVQYKGKFFVSKLFKNSSGIKDFSFSFRTIPLNIDIVFDGLRAYSKTDRSLNRIEGRLIASDRLDVDAVETIVSASQGNKKLSLKWEAQEDGKAYTFTIDSINRTDNKEMVLISWKGKGDGFSVEGSKEYEVPALDEFILLDHKIVQYPEQYIQLVFSDPLKVNQNLEGLIYLENFTDLRFSLEENIIKIFPVIRQKGTLNINISPGIQNLTGKRFNEEKVYTLNFEPLKPEIRLIGNGVIVPGSGELFFPFEAVNLKGLDVRIIRIFEDNVAQFLQMNNLDGDYELKRAGRLIASRSIDFSPERPLKPDEWNTFSLDLATLIDAEPGAIYRVELSFRRKHSLYECPGLKTEPDKESDLDDLRRREKEMELNDMPDYYGWDEYDYEYYDWFSREDPCNDAFYKYGNKIARNVLASNLGIIAKSGNDGSMLFAVTDLLTSEAIQNVKLDIYNFQQQLLASLFTDKEGFAECIVEGRPFLLIASKDRQKGYLRLDQGSSLSMSRFDISGTGINKGIKGFIYGERAVWRPGDSLYITFILEDKSAQLPENHPVTLEWFDPYGKRNAVYTAVNGLNGFYSFKIATDPSDPTGIWNAVIKLGNISFSKNFRIENIKPNRLKINLDFATEELKSYNSSLKAFLSSNWLHGAPASNLRASVVVNFKNISTAFPGYAEYVFTDPSRSFKPVEKEIFRGTLDSKGQLTFDAMFDIREQSPGKVNAVFTTRVFEKGGDFSTDIFSIPYSPYPYYIGLKTPEHGAYDILPPDTLHTFEIVSLDENASLSDRKNLQVLVYKLDWKWWWHSGDENLASYIGSSYYKPVFERRINTVKGRASFNFGVEEPDWGRFFIRVYDPESKHSTGKIVYFDYPGWTGRSGREDPSAASMLSFSASKTKYEVGEEAIITIPTGGEGKVLISIENGTAILKHHWIKAGVTETTFNFKVTKEMSPNIYVNVSLIQPHKQTQNDLPVRMYGVLPISVEDRETHLEPLIGMPEVLRPLSETEISISEKTGKAMTYSIAMVDEGLLDLTRYKTPDPWNSFYAKEALGVNSFDLYDYVLGAYGGRIDGIFSIGGDDEAIDRQEAGRAKRFPPVVKFSGPFYLPAGKTQKHKIDIPNYAGSVRIMVVAGHNAAYGSTEKTVAVRNPLMVLSTLPRILRPSETISLPVTVFAMEDNIKEVELVLELSNNIITEKKVQKLTFSGPGEKTVDFLLKTTDISTKGKVKVIATSGNEKAVSETELDILYSNPEVSSFVYGIAEAGETWYNEFELPGRKGTNTGILEVSALPPLDFGRRLKYLADYPYAGTEQIISSAFPRLYQADVMDTDDKMRSLIKNRIESAINKIRSMQLSTGGISGWPDGLMANEWLTSYAGHFLIEAKKKGYAIDKNFLNNCLRFQKQTARKWTAPAASNKLEKASSELSQAYRLYTLALAGEAENGAMNRLRESPGLSSNAAWRLAAAYALAGQKESARMMTEKLERDTVVYTDPGFTYGSGLRDMAMILESMLLIGEKEKAIPLMQEISAALSSDSWFNTQSLAFALISMSRFMAGTKTPGDLKYEYSIDNEKLKYAASKSNYSTIEHDFKESDSASVRVINKGDGPLYIRFSSSGIPLSGEEKASSSNLSLSVNYLDMQGNVLDISRLEQGTDFMAIVSVYNNGILGNYRDMALTQIFPPGWEIQNIRLFESNYGKFSIPAYQDIRDDRVLTYFDIDRGKREQFAVKLNAAYKGKYYLPPVYCEAMYRSDINALIKGQWVEVIEAGAGDSLTDMERDNL